MAIYPLVCAKIPFEIVHRALGRRYPRESSNFCSYSVSIHTSQHYSWYGFWQHGILALTEANVRVYHVQKFLSAEFGTSSRLQPFRNNTTSIATSLPALLDCIHFCCLRKHFHAQPRCVYLIL
jgi:hypothetical protein